MLDALLRLRPVYSALAFLRARRVVITGWSMYPTLAPGERVLFDGLALRADPPRRGDVVLACHPDDRSKRLVKRVAAVPGEAAGEGTLGADEYLLVGDAPDLSTDSRHFGPVRRGDILGRAWLVYWPPQRMRRLQGGATGAAPWETPGPGT